MENTSKNNYAKTCVLNVTADVKDGKNYVSDVYFTSPFKVISVTMQVWSSFPNPMKSFTKWMVAMLVETAPLK